MATGLGVNEVLIVLLATFLLVKLPRMAHRVLGNKETK